MGTEIRNTRRQLIGARRPPSTSPMNEPLMPAMLLMPRAMPRWFSGKASVRMAAELATRNAAPTPWKMRPTTSHKAPTCPVNGVTVRTRENNV
jgi:hypothetical protein